MARMKAIFIGDYSDKKTVEMLKSFCMKYHEDYDIIASGYRAYNIEKTKEITEKCSIVGMNAQSFTYHKNTAQFVIITTAAVRYVNEKKNQKVIVVLSDFNEASFAGIMGNISHVITDKQTTYNYFSGKFDHIKVYLVGQIEDYIECIEPMMQEDKQFIQDYLLVSISDDPGLWQANGARHFIKSITEESNSSVIGLSKNRIISDATNTLIFDGTTRTNSVLKEFEGIVVFYDDASKVYYQHYIESSEITTKDNPEVMLQSLNLKKLEIDALKYENIEWEETDTEYEKYRHLIEKIYIHENSSNAKVSIIICRYNTPYELLSRAILSALNTGHENVEVIVVDDGSQSSLENKIKNNIPDCRIAYYYKENEGPGLSRDFGIRQATGKYVFFLDSDDTIHPQSMRCLVAHAEHFRLNMVIGKRVLCDENGVPRNESLKHLSNDSFACFYGGNHSRNDIFTDVMVNNLLINKEYLEKNNIRFVKGLYEDVEYTAKLYQNCPEFHYVNVVIHDWYQYGDSSTISSTPTIANLRERVIKENMALEHIPERLRQDRIYMILSIGFNMYLNAYFCMGEKEQEEAWELIRGFLSDKREFIQIDYYTERVKELVRAILQNNRDYFEYVINRYYIPKTNDEEHDDYIIFTHYHLYVAILRTIASKRKSRLYLGQFYANFDTRMAFALRESGLFETVKTFTFGTMVPNLFKELKQRPGEAGIIIPDHLYNPFAYYFKECNTKRDTAYIFSDTHPYWYYIEREFENIIKLEDAYNSFDREVKTHKMTGIWAGIQEYEGKEYPLMFYRSSKISKIITSKKPEGIPYFYLEKIVVEDTKELEKKHRDELKDVLFDVYDINTDIFTKDSVLLLTQPLAQFGYCTKSQQKTLMKIMCKNVSPDNLLIKPHPADKVNYSFLGGKMLPKNVPIEVYNFMDISIARAVTFGSSAIETIEIAREKKVFFKLHDFSFDDVVQAIIDIVYKEPANKADRLKKRIKRTIKRILS